MPTYNFECSECGYKIDRYVSITYPKKSECPQCHKKSLIRCIGTGGGFIFKRDGFYETDVKQKGDYVKENDDMNKEREERKKIDPDF